METRHTAFLISNIHCSSCVRSIEEALYRLKPPPLAVSHSIVQHSITVTHPPSLAVETISDTLEEEGYEVFSIVKDALSDDPTVTDDPRLVVPEEQKSFAAPPVIRRFTSSRSLATKRRRKEQHEKHCEQCKQDNKTEKADL